MIVEIRIDDRLVHGQVLQGWVPKLGIEKIAVICNDDARSVELATIYNLTMPPSLAVDVISTEKLASALAELSASEQRIMILASGLHQLAVLPLTYLHPRVTLGNCCGSEADPLVDISQSFRCDPDNIVHLRQLLNAGVRVVACAGAYDSVREINEVPCP